VGEGWLTRLQSYLSKDSTYGKKSADQVGNRDYDKNQQHRGHCQQDDAVSKLLHADRVIVTNEDLTAGVLVTQFLPPCCSSKNNRGRGDEV
jgi:hypothetical protein